MQLYVRCAARLLRVTDLCATVLQLAVGFDVADTWQQFVLEIRTGVLAAR